MTHSHSDRRDDGQGGAGMRQFSSGATRNEDTGRPDPEGFLSPLVIDRFNEYMAKNRLQADGSLRDSDNWQKGIPLDAYMKGAWRHFLHLWQRHRGWVVTDPQAARDIEEDLCALIFNAQGYLHELVKGRYSGLGAVIERAAASSEAPRVGSWGGDTSHLPPHYRSAEKQADPASSECRKLRGAPSGSPF